MVQAAVLDPPHRGRDLLVSSRTGSGKTIAFGLAMAETLLGAEPAFGEAGVPGALVVAPTRELAIQVQRELAWLYGAAGGRVASCVGGMDARRGGARRRGRARRRRHARPARRSPRAGRALDLGPACPRPRRGG